MIKRCEKCDKNLGDVWHSTRYCTECKSVARRESLLRFAPQARIKTKLWRKNNHKRALAKQKECYFKRRNYYLQWSKRYRELNKKRIKKREKQARNQEPHRLILFKNKISMVCKCCGCKENYKGLQLSAHHINGNNQDNRLENLVWICESCHQYIHNPKGIHSEMIQIDGYKKESR